MEDGYCMKMLSLNPLSAFSLKKGLNRKKKGRKETRMEGRKRKRERNKEMRKGRNTGGKFQIHSIVSHQKKR